MIIYPDANLPANSQDWANKVEAEIVKLDKRVTQIPYIEGPAGLDGLDGAQGPQGDQGPEGPQGPKGDQGPQGIQGIKGDDGPIGLAGKDGKDGKNGVDGLNGFDGKNGINGLNGKNGKDGKDGKPGKDGKDGKPGKDGKNGQLGFSAYEIAKSNGFKGTEKEWLDSLKGINGVRGPKGDRGAKGDAGFNGAMGAPGPQGPAGNDGAPGPAGADGAPGAAGPAGVGIAVGGTAGQILAKNSATNYDTGWIDNYTETIKHLVKNDGIALSKGMAVYVSAANGTNMIVSPASNAAEATSSKTMGLLETSLAINATGYVITEGLLSGLDTSTAQAGDPVWLGVNGNLIYGLANKPKAPAHLVFIGIVTRVQAQNGEIFIRPQNGFELDELHSVLITSPTNNQVLSYDSATGLWKNKDAAASGVTSITVSAPLTGGTITSSGSIGIDQSALAINKSQVTNLNSQRRYTSVGLTCYVGTAVAGLAEATTGWNLTRIITANNGTVTVARATNSWSNYFTATYV